MKLPVLLFFTIGIAVALNAKPNVGEKPSTTPSATISADEMFRRYQKAQKEIDELNKKYPSATFGITKFSFMTEAERKAFSGVTPSPFPELRHIETFDDENITAPESYDYRDYGKVTPVKDQDVPNSCGSCYDFAATAAVESQFLIQENVELDLSEEYVLACDTLDGACVGGFPKHALDVFQTKGVPTENCDPYIAMNETCPVLDDSCGVYGIDGYRTVGTDESKYPGLLYKYGPITIAFKDGEKFQQYKSGVMDFPLEECGTGGHAVLLVGYTPDYWIAKNSWGIEDFGEEGYFRFKRGINWCNFATLTDNLIPY